MISSTSGRFSSQLNTTDESLDTTAADKTSPGTFQITIPYTILILILVHIYNIWNGFCTTADGIILYTPALKPGRVIRVTFSPGHPGLTRFTIYPGLTRIGSREKRNCSFDDVELINAIA